jgi:hypothetical protein
MSYRIRVPESSETPIERIFEKVVRRKMTPEERLCFQLKPFKAQVPETSNNDAHSGHNHKRRGKLTRH